MTADSGSHRILRSLFAGVVGTFLFAAIGAVSTHLMALNFGPSDFGLFTLGASLATTAAGLTEFGQTQMLQREIAIDPGNETELISQSLGLRLVMAVLALITFCALGVLIYGRRGSNSSAVIAASVLILPSMAITQTLSAHFLNHFRNQRLTEVGVLQQILNLTGVLVAINTGAPIYWCAISVSATSALQCLVLFVIARRQISVRPRFDCFMWWIKLKSAAPLGLSALLGSFYLKADILILGVLGLTSQLGYYGVAISISSFFLVLPGLLVRVFMPVISRHGESGRRASTDMLSYAWAIGSLSVVLVYLGAPVAIRVFAGTRFAASVTPLRILGLSVLSVFVGSALAAYCVAGGFHKKLGIITGAMLASNIVANFLAIPKFGIIGSAWATTLCEFVGLILLSRLIRQNSTVRFSNLQRPWPALVSGLVTIAACAPLCAGFMQNVLSVVAIEFLAVAVFVVSLVVFGGLPFGVVQFLAPHSKHTRPGFFDKFLWRSDWTRHR